MFFPGLIITNELHEEDFLLQVYLFFCFSFIYDSDLSTCNTLNLEKHKVIAHNYGFIAKRIA